LRADNLINYCSRFYNRISVSFQAYYGMQPAAEPNMPEKRLLIITAGNILEHTQPFK